MQNSMWLNVHDSESVSRISVSDSENNVYKDHETM